MQFHILDENYTPVAVMDNDLPDAINFNNSKFHRFLTGSADFFDFETSKLHVDHNQLQVGYWVAFKYDYRDRLLYINKIAEAESDKMMSISTLSNNLDLNKENTLPFSADTARPFSWYFDIIMYDTGYEIGINEISNLTRKLSWDSEMSHRSFLQSVATQFDNAELDYEVILNSDFTIKKRLVHIKKQVGEVREDIELRYRENIKTVKRSTNIDNLYTAIRPISKDDNDKITTIASYPDWQQLDENGNVKFFHKQGEDVIKAPIANARFGNRGINVTGGGYVVYDFSYDKASQSELFNRASKELETISVPAINYDVEGRTGAKIGDTVKIVDDGYSPELILSARVLEQVVSFDDATAEQATFGNYKALKSQISDDLIAKMQKLAEENAPYKTQTLTTNGLIFKNSEGNTTLTARLFKGTKEIVPDKFVWSVSDVISDNETSQLLVNADDINVKSVVRWSAVINGVTVAFDEVTITDVSDGVDGISPTVTVNPDTSLTIVDAQGTKTTPVLKGTKGTNGADGKDALNLTLSNQSVTIPATYDGSVQSYSRTGTRIDLTEGSTVLQYDEKGVTAGTWKVSAVVTGITCGAIVDSGAYATVANHSGMTTDSAMIEYTITGKRSNGANFDIKASQSFSKSKQGIVGVSSYTWIRYSANSNGTSMTTQPGADTKYIGLYTGASATPPTSNIDYTWSNYVGSNGIDGAKGDPTGVTKQATEPASAQRFSGMLWQYTGTASMSITGTTATPNAIYRWTSSAWELWYFYAANIQADAAFFNLLNVSSATVDNLGVNGSINANLIAPTPGNLLFNPEIQSNSWDDGWTQTGSLVSNFYQSETFVTDAGGSRSQMIGINSLSEEGKTSSNWNRFNQDVKIRAGFTYSGSAVLYSPNTNSSSEGIAINILFLDKDKKSLTNASSVTHTVKTYTTIKLENQIAPTGAVYLRFAVIAKGRTNSYATRMMLNIGASVAPYSPNGSALTITGDMIVDGAIKAQKLNVNTLSAISSDIGMMIAGVIKVMADIIINAAGMTKKFGMLFTKKGLLSTGPTFDAAGKASDTKMAVASLTQGELRFIHMDYNENLEQVQDSGTSSANNGFIRFSSTAEKGDLLEITSSKILLNGYATQTSPWITLSTLAKYRVAFGTVTVAVGLINGSSSNAIYLGSIPVELRPADSRMFCVSAWWVDTSRDRHVQLNADQGNMVLLNPYPNQEYRFEVTWTIPM